MMSIILAVWRVLGLKGVLVIVAVCFAAYWHLAAVSEAYDRGAQSVRLQWQEANRRAELKAIAKQKQQQDEINKVEIDLLNSRAMSATRIRSLEEALEAERQENEKNGIDLSACRLTDRMRDQLLYNRP